ncbi:MAG: DNA recombination protein RmuC [Acidobacteria bacterium]|nr:MAG: DNA recombination protein RmuC [Acidobacteriota bacterium]PYY02507.1 MAG: DNA recombination protein RmuC [Acidobacteriota bacterium]PYY24471.1 MAG: DNA recombination protein RmuC [Acidobacteriota bacterium]
MGLLLINVFGLAVGIACTYLLLQGRMAVSLERVRNFERYLEQANCELQRLGAEVVAKSSALLEISNQLSATRAELAAERQAAIDKLALVQQSEQRLSESFDLLAAKALRENTAEFLKLAKNQFEHEQRMASGDLGMKKDAIQALLETASSSLKALDEQIRSSDVEHKQAEAALGQQITSLVDLQHRLSDETRRLSRALERPTVRGNWGEVQLRRVVEFAGMIEHCHFESQKTFSDEDGNRLRPDLVVHMPNGRMIAVDAKVSLEAFTKATNADQEEEVRAHLEQHAAQVRKHVDDLASKAYWQQFPNSPDFVVAFMPSEALLSAALQADSTLLDDAAQSKVLLATPLTLIALLKAVHCGWREDRLAKNAEEISAIGRLLYSRLVTLGTHLSKLGDNIDRTVATYNQVIGSIERSAFPAARKFEQLGASSADILPELEFVEHLTRPLQSPEWKQSDANDAARDFNNLALAEGSGKPS